MKKILPITFVIIFIIMTFFTFNTQKTYAGRGCCSWHGGQAYCGSNGKWICQDGTESPSCTCTNGNKINDSLGFNPLPNCSAYENKIEKLEAEKEELIEEKERLQTDKENLYTLLIITVAIFGIYIFYKKK